MMDLRLLPDGTGYVSIMIVDAYRGTAMMTPTTAGKYEHGCHESSHRTIEQLDPNTMHTRRNRRQ